jgi:DNA-nicking Smr family endonuclease
MARDRQDQNSFDPSPFKSLKGLSVSGAERDEFLAAVDQLDPPVEEDLPADGDSPRARPRRMKQLERGALRPDGELDLHGLVRDEAVARTRGFLAHAVRQKWSVVVIVTGKGLHSAEGPVLRRAVEQLLDGSRDLVLEWGEAPRRFGGAGALAVFVKMTK